VIEFDALVQQATKVCHYLSLTWSIFHTGVINMWSVPHDVYNVCCSTFGNHAFSVAGPTI